MKPEATTVTTSTAARGFARGLEGLLAWSRRPASILSAMALAVTGLLVAPPSPDPSEPRSPPATEAPAFLDEFDCSIPGDLFGALQEHPAGPTPIPGPGAAQA